MATITEIAAQLVDVELEIQGIRNAFDPRTMPTGAISKARLPAIYNLPGEGIYNAQSQGYVLITRTWRIMLAVAPITHPLEISIHSKKVEPYFLRLQRALYKAVQLDGLDGVQLARLTRDFGLTPVAINGELFAGTEFQIETISRFDDTTAA